MSIKNSVLISAGVVAAFAGGVVATSLSDRMSGVGASPSGAPAPVIEQARTATPAGPLPDLSAVAERAIQASVNISSTQRFRTDPFEQLFYGADPVIAQTSLGSGVIVSTDGYVLTNSHVVGDLRASIKVTLADNRELPATIVGIDPDTDLAVLKLKLDDKAVAPLPWGDSGKLRVAEWVLAVGNPFALNQTVTLGIVSAQNRHDPQLATYNDFIQTDAAVNKGNSGGALVSSRGELVGINTMIYSETGGFVGISFAIPSNLARDIMTDLIPDGVVLRGSIGNLQLLTITADQARRNRLGDRGGVYVRNMLRSDPAHLNGKGIQPGDIIVKFGNTEITEQSQLARLIADTKIGATVPIEVIRGGERRTFQIPVVRRSSPTRR